MIISARLNLYLTDERPIPSIPSQAHDPYWHDVAAIIGPALMGQSFRIDDHYYTIDTASIEVTDNA